MSQLLRMLSPLLELEEPIISRDELAELTDATREILLNHQILVPSRPARHETCAACHEDHIEEVVRIKSRSGDVNFWIPCPDAGWVKVPHERLEQWTVDTTRFASLLANTIGSGHVPEAIVPNAAWRLGMVEIAGEAYGVVFVRHEDVSVVEQMRKRLPPQRTIVLQPRDSLDAVDGFAAVVSLDSAFTFDGKRFECDLSRLRSALATDSGVTGNVFRRRGEFWEISFEKETTYFKDSVGLGYIARLLAEPRRDIPAVTLLASRAGIDPLVTTGASGVLLDDEARENYGKRYRELQKELEEAELHHDLGRVYEIKKERDQLAIELARATGLGGRSRKITDADRVRRSVSMAVSRDIDRIAKENSTFGQHLLNSIFKGIAFRYEPDRKLDWLT